MDELVTPLQYAARTYGVCGCVCQVDDEVANVLVAQLLYLAQEDKEKDITLYINRYPTPHLPLSHSFVWDAVV